jgi:hypothetical protein
MNKCITLAHIEQHTQDQSVSSHKIRGDPESAAQLLDVVDSDAAGVEDKKAKKRGDEDELPKSKLRYHTLIERVTRKANLRCV